MLEGGVAVQLGLLQHDPHAQQVRAAAGGNMHSKDEIARAAALRLRYTRLGLREFGNLWSRGLQRRVRLSMPQHTSCAHQVRMHHCPCMQL